jgi:SOS response regulatory protein OraA/RecX
MGPEYADGKAFNRANQMIDSLEALARRNPDKIAIPRAASEAAEIAKQNKLAAAFDRITAPPEEMDEVTYIPKMTRELVKRGYSDDDIRKILGGNFMRVFAAAGE